MTCPVRLFETLVCRLVGGQVQAGTDTSRLVDLGRCVVVFFTKETKHDKTIDNDGVHCSHALI